MRRALALAVGMALAGIGLAAIRSPAAAQVPTPSDDEVNAVAKDMYCPVCENIPLDVCPTQACAQWRETIREKLALGWTVDQIHQYFVEQYGARVLAAPPPTGLNWLVYVLPPLGIAGGAYLLWRTLRTWKRPVASAPAAQPSDDPYIARLEEELRRRD